MNDTMIRAYEVGGCVRDGLLGVRSKDVDYAVEAPSYSAMRAWLVGRDFEIFEETLRTLTIRARYPRDDPKHGNLTADFVLCRKDGRSANHRHPDECVAGTLADDLDRRDFTVNAMAIDPDTGAIIDRHHGQEDLAAMILRFVGDPAQRLDEDALRALRAFRFCVTRGFTLADATRDALADPIVQERLMDPSIVSTERVREELHKAFKVDTVGSLELLNELHLMKVLFKRNGLWLEPTMRGPRKAVPR